MDWDGWVERRLWLLQNVNLNREGKVTEVDVSTKISRFDRLSNSLAFGISLFLEYKNHYLVCYLFFNTCSVYNLLYILPSSLKKGSNNPGPDPESLWKTWRNLKKMIRRKTNHSRTKNIPHLNERIRTSLARIILIDVNREKIWNKTRKI